MARLSKAIKRKSLQNMPATQFTTDFARKHEFPPI